jgi:very-short-patch-repair endonuclease
MHSGGTDTLGLDGPTMQILDYWGAALSHRSAAELWELLPGRGGPVDISVVGDGGKRKRGGIRLHRSLLLVPAAVTLRRGIPVTTPAKTIADLRAASTGKRRLVTPRELRRAIRQANVLGLPIDERDRRRRERSDLEEDFLALCRRHRLPMPEVNVRVGEHLVDFLWRERMVVVETDGFIYHRGRAAFEDDRGTDLSLRALGYDVVRLADTQIDEEPTQIAAVLRRRLAPFPSIGPETRQAAP